MITDKKCILVRPHFGGLGDQRIYDLGKGYGLSLINSELAHTYEFAWEAAVINLDGDRVVSLDYSTPLTNDVEVFATDEDANEFIERAIAWVDSLPGASA